MQQDVVSAFAAMLGSSQSNSSAYEAFESIKHLYQIHLSCNALNDGTALIYNTGIKSHLSKFKLLTHIQGDENFMPANVNNIKIRRQTTVDEHLEFFVKEAGQHEYIGHVKIFNPNIISQCKDFAARNFEESSFIRHAWDFIANYIEKNPPAQELARN